VRVRVLQHVPFEGPAGVAAWAASRGHELEAVRLFDGARPPAPSELDLLVVLGGPMSVDDEDRHAFLAGEKRAIRCAIDAGRPVLGICLGAQLVASALGARVVANALEEVGWYPVSLAADAGPLFAGVPARFPAFHWHGDTFEIPPGAVRAASSEACANQAFVYRDHVAGVQFHPEVTAESLALMLEHESCGAGPYVQPPDALCAPGRPYGESAAVLATLLDNLARIDPRDPRHRRPV
jgi:GMP synthase-like glutamine amidotransferase